MFLDPVPPSETPKVLQAPFLLAPMAELSHRALREVIEHFGGCDRYYSEMISAGALAGNGPFEKYYLDAGPVPEKFVYQLCGGKAEQIAAAAEILDDRVCAGIDLNMGCSAPAIVRTGSGAAWMNDIDKAAALVAQVRAKVTRHRLSAKLRIGPTDNFEYLVLFCKRLQDEGLEQITLHPRTAKEKFRLYARWDYVERLKKELRIPLAGNGDIKSAEDLACRAASGICDEVMAGRLAVQKPWCFAQAKGLIQEAAIDLQETALLFLDLLRQHQPEEFLYSRARRFFFYFCNNLTWAEYMRNKLNREKNLDGMAREWKAYFDA